MPALYEAGHALERAATVRTMRRTGVLIAIAVLVATACSSSSNAGSESDTTTPKVRIVNLNLLHGTACPPESNRCDLPGRVALFHRQLDRAGCPEIVAIEEANPTTVTELARAPSKCDYEIVSDDDPGQDREVVLTTLRVLGSTRLRLPGPLRTAYRVLLASDAGPVDLIATHLASGSDDRPCDATTCPPPCKAADSVNTCQARQIVATMDDEPGPARAIRVLTGDLNAQPDEPTIQVLTDAGLIDTHLEVGNAECDPTTGANCTSGRIDDALTDLTDAASTQTERIDYVFVAPSRRCTVIRPTGVFAAKGGPTGQDGLVFPADHSAVEATLRCRTSAADLAASKPIRTTTTTGATAATLTDAVRADVTAAFTTLFAPNPDPDAQLAALENGAALRESFIERKQQVGPLADQTSVRIDSFDGATADAVDVTFSILLNGAVVLDALPGQAIRVDGKWLVTTTSYCQVATLGIDTIPEPCQ